MPVPGDTVEKTGPSGEVADLGGLLVGGLTESHEYRSLVFDVTGRGVAGLAFFEHLGHGGVPVVDPHGEEALTGGVAAVIAGARATADQDHRADGHCHGNR